MKLFFSLPSPFARKVLVVLIETDQISDVELESVKIGPLNPGEVIPNFNPLGKIPTLVLPTGEALIDSKLICRFFGDKQKEGQIEKLYPTDDRIWEVLNYEALADGIMEAAILLVYEQRIRNQEQRVEGWVIAQKLKITRTLDFLETNSHKLQTGVNIGNLTVAIALDYLDFRHQNIEWRLGRPFLAQWYETIRLRNSLITTLPQD